MRLLNKFLPGKTIKNQLANKKAIPLPTLQLKTRIAIPVVPLEINREEFLKWQSDYFPEGVALFKTGMHKKMLELYVSFLLLDIQQEDVYMDAAGGQYSYASRINCRKKIIQDIRLSEKLKSFHGDKVTYLDSSCAAIPLDDKSVHKISCHHSIEHFQQNADVDFIKEVQRLLTPGGKCVILPIFINEVPLLITDERGFTQWNEAGEWVTDKSATLPGGSGSGHFSRVYSPESLTSRLIEQLDRATFTATLVTVQMNGEEIPNEKLFMTSGQAIMNHSYRALVLERI